MKTNSLSVYLELPRRGYSTNISNTLSHPWWRCSSTHYSFSIQVWAHPLQKLPPRPFGSSSFQSLSLTCQDWTEIAWDTAALCEHHQFFSLAILHMLQWICSLYFFAIQQDQAVDFLVVILQQAIHNAYVITSITSDALVHLKKWTKGWQVVTNKWAFLADRLVEVRSGFQSAVGGV